MGKAILAILFVALRIPVVAEGTTWYVDDSVPSSGDGTTWETAFNAIQEGIDAASGGDTVVVAEGTYFENVHFRGENIILRSTDPLDPAVVGSTVIEPERDGPVVTFEGTEDHTCVLEGFTIQNGRGDTGGGIQGSFQGYDTGATIQNNTIRNNLAAGHLASGGGIDGCSGRIQNNVIVGNSARNGGGLAGCHGTIRNNVITENVSEGYGGGLSHCHGTIQNNLISGNSSGSWGGGLSYCDGTIQDNTITGNVAVQSGGGIAVSDIAVIQNNRIHGNISEEGSGGGLSGCDGTIRNNVIMANSAAVHGGGLSGCEGTILGNLIYGNRARSSTGGLSGCTGTIANNTIVGNEGVGMNQCEGTIINCIVWGNTAPEGQLSESSTPAFSCIQDWTEGGDGNTPDNPRFLDTDGPDGDPETYDDNDYRLSSDSPCIDAGDNSVLDRPRFDIEWNLRIAFGQDSLTVDMGAYEYNSVPFVVTKVIVNECGILEITWTSQPNDRYMIWSVTDIGTELWPPEAIVFSQGETTSWLRSFPADRKKFYRVQMW
jgi:hypothetical protein